MIWRAETTAENLKKRPGTRQLSSGKLTFNAIFKYTTHCWKSCGAENREKMAELTMLGPGWKREQSKPLHQCYLTANVCKHIC